MMPRISRSFRAIIIALLLHLILLALLLLAWYQESEQQSQQPSELTLPEPEAPVMFLEEPAPGPAQPQPEEAQEQHPEKETPLEVKEEVEQQFEEIPLLPTPQITTQQTPPKRNKDAWFKKPPVTETRTPTKTQTPPLDYFKFEHQSEAPAKNSSSLHERIKTQFADNALNRYMGLVAQSLCYEINKQKIYVSNSDFPYMFTFRLIIQRSGELEAVQLVTQSSNPEVNQLMRKAFMATSPLRAIPETITQAPLTLTFNLFTDHKERDSTIKHPLRIYISDPNNRTI